MFKVLSHSHNARSETERATVQERRGLLESQLGSMRESSFSAWAKHIETMEQARRSFFG